MSAIQVVMYSILTNKYKFNASIFDWYLYQPSNRATNMFLKSIYVRGVLHTLQSIFIWEVRVAVLDAEIF